MIFQHSNVVEATTDNSILQIILQQRSNNTNQTTNQQPIK
jgi:hypothetical protein